MKNKPDYLKTLNNLTTTSENITLFFSMMGGMDSILTCDIFRDFLYDQTIL